MKTCPYCMWEIPDRARKCKFCWEWVIDDNNPFRNWEKEGKIEEIKEDIDDEVEDDDIDDEVEDDDIDDEVEDLENEDAENDEDRDNYDEDEKDNINPGTPKKEKSYGRVWWIIVWFFALVWTLSSINSDKEKQENKEIINNWYDKAIENRWEVELSDIENTISSYKPQNAREQEMANELLDIMNELSENIEGISEDAFYIEDKDLHNLNLLNSSVSQLKQFKNALNNYVQKYKSFSEKWKLGSYDKWVYSYSELATKMDEYANAQLNFADSAIEYYNYVIIIQDYFYYDEVEEQIYFYQDSPDSAMDKFNDLYKKFVQAAVNFLDADEKYSDYYVEYLKNAKSKSN